MRGHGSSVLSPAWTTRAEARTRATAFACSSTSTSNSHSHRATPCLTFCLTLPLVFIRAIKIDHVFGVARLCRPLVKAFNAVDTLDVCINFT